MNLLLIKTWTKTKKDLNTINNFKWANPNKVSNNNFQTNLNNLNNNNKITIHNNNNYKITNQIYNKKTPLTPNKKDKY